MGDVHASSVTAALRTQKNASPILSAQTVTLLVLMRRFALHHHALFLPVSLLLRLHSRIENPTFRLFPSIVFLFLLA